MTRQIVLLLGLTFASCFGCSPSARPPTEQSAAQDTVVQVCAITAELLGVNTADVKPSTSLGDLGADELDVVELVMELEDHFDISISDEAITNVTGDDEWQTGTDRLTMAKLAEIVDQQMR